MLTEYQQDYGRWWNEFTWDHFITLTVDPRRRTGSGRAGGCPRTMDGIARTIRHEFHRLLTKLTGGRVPFVSVVGMGAGYNPHGHMLTYGTAAIPLERLERGWRHGRITVERYQPHRGAPYYLAKHLLEPECNSEMSKTLPPRVQAAEHQATPYPPRDPSGTPRRLTGTQHNGVFQAVA